MLPFLFRNNVHVQCVVIWTSYTCLDTPNNCFKEYRPWQYHVCNECTYTIWSHTLPETGTKFRTLTEHPVSGSDIAHALHNSHIVLSFPNFRFFSISFVSDTSGIYLECCYTHNCFVRPICTTQKINSACITTLSNSNGSSSQMQRRVEGCRYRNTESYITVVCIAISKKLRILLTFNPKKSTVEERP